MSEIPRANPYLNEAIEGLNEHYHRFRGNTADAWENLTTAESEFIDDEITHCLLEPRYYLENYHVVKTEEEGLKTLFPFWESQEIFYEEIRNIQRQNLPVKVQVLKARQQGLSTISEGLVFHKTIFTKVVNTLIIAQDGQQSAFLFDMARTAYDLLPWWMQPEKRYEQAGKLLQFDCVEELARQANMGLKSNIYVEAANKMTGAARGKTIKAMHASELASWDDGGQLTKSIFPTMNSADTLAIMESTAEGRSGFWYHFWRDTVAGKTDWHPIFIEFFRVRKYSRALKTGEEFHRTKDEVAFVERVKADKNVTITDEVLNWMRKKKQEFISTEGDEFSFYGEYPSNWMEAFQGSGICAFPKRKLQKILESTVCPPRWVGEIQWNQDTAKIQFSGMGDRLRRVGKDEQLQQPEQEERFRVWEMPDIEDEYYVAVDVAMGNEGGDFSCVQVMKIGRGPQPDEQVAEWRGWINPVPLAYVAVGIATWYNYAEIAVEVNAVGISTNNEIQRVIEYENLYRWKHLDKIGNVNTVHMGWYTNFKSRDVIIAKMVEAILSNTIVLRSEWLLDEMLDFAQDDEGGKFQGQEANDDRVMTMMICHYCAHQSDSGKRAMTRPMSSKTGTERKWYVMDAMNRKMAETHDRDEAIRLVSEHKGYSMVQAQESRDFYNTAYSPIYDGDGIRSRMYHQMGYQAEDINHETISEVEAMEAEPEADNPNAWLSY